MKKYRPLAAVLIGGGIAATFDIVYAILRNGQFGKTPLWVLQSVASGWLGADAFTSGIPGGILKSQALASGAMFGVLVYLFMNFVLLPLTAFPYTLSYPPQRLLEGFASHAAFVGIPIALAIRRT